MYTEGGRIAPHRDNSDNSRLVGTILLGIGKCIDAHFCTNINKPFKKKIFFFLDLLFCRLLGDTSDENCCLDVFVGTAHVDGKSKYAANLTDTKSILNKWIDKINGHGASTGAKSSNTEDRSGNCTTSDDDDDGDGDGDVYDVDDEDTDADNGNDETDINVNQCSLKWRASKGNIIAFYRDCHHAVTHVTRGIRASIAFNVFAVKNNDLASSLTHNSRRSATIGLPIAALLNKYKVNKIPFHKSNRSKSENGDADTNCNVMKRKLSMSGPTRFLSACYAIAKWSPPIQPATTLTVDMYRGTQEKKGGKQQKEEFTKRKFSKYGTAATEEGDKTEKSKEALVNQKENNDSNNTNNNNGNDDVKHQLESIPQTLQFGLLLENFYSLDPGPLEGKDARTAQFLDQALVQGGWASSVQLIPVAVELNGSRHIDYGAVCYSEFTSSVHSLDRLSFGCLMDTARGYITKPTNFVCANLGIPFYNRIPQDHSFKKFIDMPSFGDTWHCNYHDVANASGDGYSYHNDAHESIQLTLALIVTMRPIREVLAALIPALPLVLFPIVQQYADLLDEHVDTV